MFLNCSTCFERRTAHHQELKNCNCSLWFYIRFWLPAAAMAERRLVRRADNLTTFMCRLSWNLWASNSWKWKGLSRPVMGLLFTFKLGAVLSSPCIVFPVCIAANCNWSFMYWVIILYLFLLPYVYCFAMCILLFYIL